MAGNPRAWSLARPATPLAEMLVSSATAAFLKTEKGQEVKEIVKGKIQEIVTEIEVRKNQSEEVIVVRQTEAKIFTIEEGELVVAGSETAEEKPEVEEN